MRSSLIAMVQTKVFVARGLARALLAASWNEPALLEAATNSVNHRKTSLTKMIPRLLVLFPAGEPPPRFDALVEALLDDPIFKRSPQVAPPARRLKSLISGPRRMQPGRRAHDWAVVPLETPRDLADWFGVPLPTLDGWADPQNWLTRVPDGPQQHYHRYWRATRLIEAPKAQLAKMQRRVLRSILDSVPAHPAAHGFIRGRSIVSHARQHCGRAVVLRCDIRQFFNTITRPRVQGIFRYIGYPEPVATLLASLCTTKTPSWCLPRDGWTRLLLTERHLPQGAPTSPSLANLVAHRLDRRLAGLADRFGLTFSRYADDLTFSGEHHLRAPRIVEHIRAIVEDEGFILNEAKTRLRGQNVQQRITGLSVNERPNVPRRDFDRLKAILHNCVTHGPETQNRGGHPDFRAYLEGKVAYVEMVNPAKGRRLRRHLNAIRW